MVKAVLAELAVQEELAELVVTVLTMVLNGTLDLFNSGLMTGTAVFTTQVTVTVWA